jgi:hypothetical protein
MRGLRLRRWRLQFLFKAANKDFPFAGGLRTIEMVVSQVKRLTVINPGLPAAQ